MDRRLLRTQLLAACYRLLNELNRDPYTPTYGCFDRRYWGWKLVDYPEATFQRNVYPLAWALRAAEVDSRIPRETLAEAVVAGLTFAAGCQHADGSFDQAFPHEHSFGATAFLLQPLLAAYLVVRDGRPPAWRTQIEACLRRAADFLCRRTETHGYIANHLAGAILSLTVAAEHFGDPHHEERASELLDSLLAHQSPEGWFPEYDGADPGYQTLCVQYLAQVHRLRPRPALREALGRAVDFLAWFVHPDGTFGGEYGSRRTALYYPGGLALLSCELPLAWSMTRFMLAALTERQTTPATDVDMGNLAPLLSSSVVALDADWPSSDTPAPPLPCERAEDVGQDFPQAGLHVRGTRRYYAVVGVSNGGVLKVFDRERRALLWNDGGYAGETEGGWRITTQVTDRRRPANVRPNEIELEAPFFRLCDAVPTPSRLLLLRLLNLTLMRSLALGNAVKALLVRLLISGKAAVPLRLTRRIRFEPAQVVVEDTLRVDGRLRLRWLEYGRPFVAIHMASARYFDASASVSRPTRVDVARLARQGELRVETVIRAC